MRARRLVRSVVVGAAVVLLVGACNEEPVPNISGLEPVLISTVEVLPRVDTLFVGDSLTSGDTLQLVAVVTMKSGATLTSVPVAGFGTVRALWQSSDTSVIVVDSNGVARPRGFGTATVTASAGRRASAQLTVAPAAARVDVTPATATVVEGDTLRLTAVAVDRQGRPVRGTRFTWRAVGAAATVDTTGLVRAAAVGTLRVIATTTGGVDTAVVTVLPRVFLARPSGAVGAISADNAGGISAGGDFSCGRISLDRAYCWGIDSTSQIGAAVQDTGCVNEFELLDSAGTRRVYPCALTPTRVAGPAMTQVTAGGAHACGIDAAGAAYCWGSASWGQVGAGLGGIGVKHDRPTPVSGGVRFAAISAGYAHTCALDVAGRAWCWGNDDLGQLGSEKLATSTTPIPVDPPHLVGVYRQISAGLTHTCALDAAGRAVCWGGNAWGQVGVAPARAIEQPTPVQAGLAFSQISAGGAKIYEPNAKGGVDTLYVGATCGVTPGGDAYCWGANLQGQLGSAASTVFSAAPVRIAGGGYSAIAVGGTHVCAIQNAQPVCWGTYALDRLGSVSIGPSPRRIDTGGRQVTAISSGRRHSCAVTTDGQGFCWGSNVLGPFGDGLQALLRRDWYTPVLTPR